MKRNLRWSAAVLATTTALLPGMATAQTTTNPPNYGNYQSLEALYRVGVQVTNGATTQQSAFEQDDIDGVIDYLDPAALSARFGNAYNNNSAVSSVVDLRGLPAFASYAANSPVLTIRIPQLNEDGTDFILNYNGTSRTASFNTFDDDVDEVDDATIQRLLRLLGRRLARVSPADPLAGNPNSLQSSLARSSLDLSSSDSLAEEGGGANTAGDPWIIGASYGFGSTGRFDLSRIDARIARGFRIGEGSRGLLKIDLPFNYSRVGRADAYGGQLGIAYEIPLQESRWSLEPRVAYGVTASPKLGSVGHILQGTVASRFVVQGLGRGRLVIGNMAGYSQTLATPFTDYNINPGLKNWVFRNGLAYEMPVKMRAGGRSLSLRGSYNFTAYAGDKLYNNTFHEATFSVGLRGREETVRARRDLVRFNLSTIQASGFHQYTGGVGFRF